ncbi:MAG: hypothetical protein H6657_12000 [Ardenticatenaceae bacterium]|nr:hypothetical protein [Anaerolineales bacterium]MCB8978136.1 hypothetical protein [Ardenticatenaceae bacterium]
MSSLIDVVLIIGIIAFFTGLFLGIFSKNSKTAGTAAWKWRNALLIISGVGLFITIGGVSLRDYYQESQASDLIYGLMGLLFGTLVIWTSVSELRQINRSSKMKAVSGIISGAFFTIAYGLLVILQFQGDGTFSFRDLFFVGFGTYLLIFSIRKIIQLKTAPVELETLA